MQNPYKSFSGNICLSKKKRRRSRQADGIKIKREAEFDLVYNGVVMSKWNWRKGHKHNISFWE